MKRVVDHEEMRVEWNLTSWFEKFLYVFGWIAFVYVALAFSVGFISELV